MIRHRRGAAALCLAAWLVGLGASPVGAAADADSTSGPALDADPISEPRFLPDASGDAEPMPADPDSVLTASWLEPGNTRARWGLLGSAVGVVAGVGLALWVKSEADDRYDLYLRTADPQTAAEIFDEAERYDRAALIGFGLAQISFVAMIYFLARSNDRELIPVQGEPVVRIREHGAEVGVRFHP